MKQRILTWWSGLTKIEKVIFVAVLLLILVRVWLALKIPLHIQGWAIYDDRMMVEYASEIEQSNWLGDFDRFTLAKGASFPLFLALNHFLGLPYSFTLIIMWIIAVFLFCLAFSKVIKNKKFLMILYAVLLYSPVMFHDENVQKVYRGGLIIIFALLIVAGVIGVYTRIKEENKKVIFWSVLTAVSLSFFWFLKEDSIWIMPFVVGGIVLAVIGTLRTKLKKPEKIKRICWEVAPLVVLFIAIIGYKTTNYIHYGEFTITDRQGTYFSEVIKDLIKMDGEGRSAVYWVTTDMMDKAYEASPTLKSIKDDIKAVWETDNGEIAGDLVFWTLRNAIHKAGIDKDAETTREFYKKVHEELSDAFDNGTLALNNDFYISATAKGITWDEMPEFLDFLNQSKDTMIAYEYNETGLYEATGDATGIALFNEMTMSRYVEPGALKEGAYESGNTAVKIANKITKVYKVTGKILFVVFAVFIVIFTGYILVLLIRRKPISSNIRSLYLIVLGLAGTSVALVFGTAFFCRFLSQKKVYDYASPMMPMLLALEIIAVYMMFVGGKKLFLWWTKKNSSKQEG